MAEYSFRVVNVFAEAPLAGNPLCVFEDARGLDDATMQALALQFNLSETTFLLPSEVADARVRIFTPTFEMPFAGHPTLGSAHVAREVLRRGDRLTLEMRAGRIPVTADGDRWTLEAQALLRGIQGRRSTWFGCGITRSKISVAMGTSPGCATHVPSWPSVASRSLSARTCASARSFTSGSDLTGMKAAIPPIACAPRR